MSASNGKGKPFDLNAARRSRAEVDGPPHSVMLGHRTYQLPAVPPASVLIGLGLLAARNLSGLRDVIAGLFGEANVADVLATGFDLNDLAALFEELYAMNVGEAQASGSLS